MSTNLNLELSYFMINAHPLSQFSFFDLYVKRWRNIVNLQFICILFLFNVHPLVHWVHPFYCFYLILTLPSLSNTTYIILYFYYFFGITYELSNMDTILEF